MSLPEIIPPGEKRSPLEAVAHAAWHLLDDSGEVFESSGEYLHLALDHEKLSAALDALEATGWDAHPGAMPGRPHDDRLDGPVTP